MGIASLIRCECQCFDAVCSSEPQAVEQASHLTKGIDPNLIWSHVAEGGGVGQKTADFQCNAQFQRPLKASLPVKGKNDSCTRNSIEH